MLSTCYQKKEVVERSKVKKIYNIYIIKIASL